MSEPRIGAPGPKARPVIERIADKAALTEDGCVVWTGHLDLNGYGTLGVGSKRDGTVRKVKTHRVLWEIVNGPVPDGLDLDHRCRNRACLRPDHLEPVTRQVNVLRGHGIPADNAAKTHCIHGHEFSIVNTYVDNGARVCRACKARQQRELRARRAAA